MNDTLKFRSKTFESHTGRVNSFQNVKKIQSKDGQFIVDSLVSGET